MPLPLTALCTVVALAPVGTMATVINAPVGHVSPIVQGAVVAGIFSVVNTILNLRLLRVATESKETVEKVKDYAEGAHGILDRRHTTAPPPDRKYKRNGDK